MRNRGQLLYVYLSDNEYEELIQFAKEKNMAVSAFMRYLLFQKLQELEREHKPLG